MLSSHFLSIQTKAFDLVLKWSVQKRVETELMNSWNFFHSRPISTLKRWFRPPSPPPPVRRSLTEGTACRLLGSQSCQKSVIHFETVCTSDFSGLSVAIILQITKAKYHKTVQEDWFTVTYLCILAVDWFGIIFRFMQSKLNSFILLWEYHYIILIHWNL